MLSLRAFQLPRKTPARPSIPDGIRIYAVGDVHGRADLLLTLFARIDNDMQKRPSAKPLQLFIGDYVDRGPHSRMVIDLLIERRRHHEMIYLTGNHELCLSQVLTDPSAFPEWQQMGGMATLLSYGLTLSGRTGAAAAEDVAANFRRVLPDSHRRFITSLALSFQCGDFFFAHAGVRPGIDLREQAQHDLLWIRDDFLLHEENFGKIVVHGHTPAIEPEVRPNRINIDTGAYATGRLTCLVLERDQMRFL